MNIHTLLRHLAGYLIGIALFGAAVPYSLYELSSSFPVRVPVPYAVRLAIALILGIAGLAFALWSNAALFAYGKGGPTDAFNVAISPRTQHLVIDGPYRYSRNPMVFGAFSCYFALAIYWNSIITLLLLAVCLAIMRIYIRATEEKRLLRDFGQKYEEYRNTTAMIVPFITRKHLH